MNCLKNKYTFCKKHPLQFPGEGISMNQTQNLMPGG